MEEPTVASPAAPAPSERAAARQDTDGSQETRNGRGRYSALRPRPGSWLTFGSFLLLGGSIGALIALTRLIDEDNKSNLYILAPIQVILGSVAFLASIMCIVVVFGRLGLFDRSKALGLPEGSVRALIALILLIIFVIFANIVFGSFTEKVRVRETFSGLTSRDVRNLPGEVVERRPVVTTTVPGEPLPVATFDGIYLDERRDEDASALGQQIVTALITLVTAISAFYFGSGAVAAATAAAATTTGVVGRRGPTPTLFLRRPSLPVTITRSDAGSFEPIEIELGGTVLQSSGVAATIEGDEAGSITSNNSIDNFTYTPADPADAVTITFAALDGSGVTVKLPITVLPAPPDDTGGVQPPGDTGGVQPPDDTGAVQPPDDTGGVQPPGDAGGVQPPGDTGGVQPPDDAGGVQPPDDTGGVQPPGDTGAVQPPGDAGAVQPPDDTGAVQPPDDTGGRPPDVPRE